MSAYVIAQIKWEDPASRDQYVAAFYPVFERHGGTLLAATDDLTEILEGTWQLPGTVIMRFPSTDHARAWLSDPDYQAAAQIRHCSALTNLVLVEGRD